MERRILGIDRASITFQDGSEMDVTPAQIGAWREYTVGRYPPDVICEESIINQTFVLRDKMSGRSYEIPKERFYSIQNTGEIWLKDLNERKWPWGYSGFSRTIHVEDEPQEPDLQIGDEKAFNDLLDSFKITTSEELNK